MKRNLTLSTQGQELIYKLILTHRAIEKSINKFNQQHFQITAEQGFVLNIIEMRGKTTIEELAHLLLRELSTISSLISRMEKKGLVKKVLGNNGRVYTIKMTTKAKKIWNGDKVDQLIQGFISILSEEERSHLDKSVSKVLDKALEGLEEYYSSPFIANTKVKLSYTEQNNQ